jgi:hypothetical protein
LGVQCFSKAHLSAHVAELLPGCISAKDRGREARVDRYVAISADRQSSSQTRIDGAG